MSNPVDSIIKKCLLQTVLCGAKGEYESLEFAEVKCGKCGASIHVPDDAVRIVCEYCGTEYVLSCSSHDQKYEPYKQVKYMGLPEYLFTFVPEGWSLQVQEDTQSSSLFAGYCAALHLDSPQGERLLFYPFAYFKDFDPNGTTLGGSFFGMFSPGASSPGSNYYLDGMSCTRYRQRVDIGHYIPVRLGELFGMVQNLRFEPVEDTDGLVQKRADAFSREAYRTLGGPVDKAFAKIRFSCIINGSPYSGLYATALSGLQQISHHAQTGGFLQGLLSMGGMVGQQQAQADWGRAFDFALLVPGELRQEHLHLFDCFCDATNYGQGYFELQAREVANVRQIQTQGAMWRQQNAAMAQRRLHQTMSETTDIIHSGYEQRSRVMGNIADKYSEAVRGVNTYTNASGRDFQADVGYDHVYQRGSTFVGSKDGSVELGPDWQELKRKD